MLTGCGPHCNENPINVFQEKELRGLSPNLQYILMCLWAIYIFTWSVHIFSCSGIGRPIVGKYKLLTDTWMWKLRLRPSNFFSRNIYFDFPVLCLCSAHHVEYAEANMCLQQLNLQESFWTNLRFLEGSYSQS
jgi:hypothetical protein